MLANSNHKRARTAILSEKNRHHKKKLVETMKDLS